MDLMKLIKGTDIGDCVARLLFTWNADHPDAEKAKETFISAIKARMPQQARLNLSSAEKLSNSIDRYLIKNDTEMYAAVKIGSAMMLAALANRETENAALVRSAAESFISDIPDGIADDREALSEIIFSEKEGREKLIDFQTAARLRNNKIYLHFLPKISEKLLTGSKQAVIIIRQMNIRHRQQVRGQDASASAVQA